MPLNWTTQDIISLIRFINIIWRRVEKTEENLDETSLLEVLETKLQHLSEKLEYLRRETEHEKSVLVKEGEKRREVGVMLGQLSVDLNVLDIMVGRVKGGLNVDEDSFEGALERLDVRLEEMNGMLEKVRRVERTGLGWITSSWHHVHWDDLVEVRYPKEEFIQAESRDEKEMLKVDMRRDEGFDDDCITVFVRFQDNGFEAKVPASGIEVVAPKSTNLGDLKKALREKIGVPICQQLLSHRGSMLDNDFTLQDCGLENESTLNGVIISKHMAEGSSKTHWSWANGS